MTLEEAKAKCKRMTDCAHGERIERCDEVWRWLCAYLQSAERINPEAVAFVFGELTFYLGSMAGDLMMWRAAFLTNDPTVAPWEPRAPQSSKETN